MKKLDVKMAMLLSVMCLIGGLFVVPYQLELLRLTLNPSDYAVTIGDMPFSLSVLTMISSIQIWILSFIIAFAGIKVARRTGFSFSVLQSICEKGKKVALNGKSFWLSVVFGAITGFIIVGADKFYFRQLIPELSKSEPETSLIGLTAGVFYGGVFEEILMRLLLMSLLVWGLSKLFNRKKDRIDGWIYWISIMIATLVFAAGHLPITATLFGELTRTILFRCFLLNGIGGLFFGYLYWKRGLEYSIISHMFAHITMQLLFYPLFY